MRRLRGRWFDPFGHTEERRLERRLVRDYEALIGELLQHLDASNHAIAVQLAEGPQRIRGYGHVKLASVATTMARQRDLLDRFHGRGAPAAAGRTIPIAAVDS
jgi:indolepyruvate ferredoxin oxidoreductase